MNADEVEALARRAHADQVDKARRPYAEHLGTIAEGVRNRGVSGEQIVAAGLYDSVEDDVLSSSWLQDALLAQQTKDIVLAVTGARETPADYSERILTTPGARLVKEVESSTTLTLNALRPWMLPFASGSRASMPGCARCSAAAATEG